MKHYQLTFKNPGSTGFVWAYAIAEDMSHAAALMRLEYPKVPDRNILITPLTEDAFRTETNASDDPIIFAPNDNPSDIPADFQHYQGGIYLAPSEPSKVWFAIKKVLETAGEEPTDEMCGALATQMIDIYAEKGITAILLEE